VYSLSKYNPVKLDKSDSSEIESITQAALVEPIAVAVEPALSRIPTGGTSYTTPEKDYRTLKKLAQVSDKEAKSLNEDFMIKTLTDFESLCNDVVFQRQKSVYLHKI
jgi:hypothetical protein